MVDVLQYFHSNGLTFSRVENLVVVEVFVVVVVGVLEGTGI